MREGARRIRLGVSGVVILSKGYIVVSYAWVWCFGIGVSGDDGMIGMGV